MSAGEERFPSRCDTGLLDVVLSQDLSGREFDPSGRPTCDFTKTCVIQFIA